jgi:hypothetical protein
MAPAERSSSTQSLGAWLAALRSGDPCPWCGAALHAMKSGSAAENARDGLGVGRAGGPVLVCKGCGSEIEAADDVPDASDRHLYRAA